MKVLFAVIPVLSPSAGVGCCREQKLVPCYPEDHVHVRGPARGCTEDQVGSGYPGSGYSSGYGSDAPWSDDEGMNAALPNGMTLGSRVYLKQSHFKDTGPEVLYREMECC